jgi:hypothetical protein
MARPPLGEVRKKNVNLTLDQDVLALAIAHCRQRRISVSALVESLLEREAAAGRGVVNFPTAAAASPARASATKK